MGLSLFSKKDKEVTLPSSYQSNCLTYDWNMQKKSRESVPRSSRWDRVLENPHVSVDPPDGPAKVELIILDAEESL